MVEGVVAIGNNKRDEQNRVEGFSSEEKAELLDRIWKETSEQICLAQMIYNDDGNPVDYCILDINPAVEKVWGIPRSCYREKGHRIVSLFLSPSDPRGKALPLEDMPVSNYLKTVRMALL